MQAPFLKYICRGSELMGLMVLVSVTVGATAVAIIGAIGILLVLFDLMQAAALRLQIRNAPVTRARRPLAGP